MHECRCIQSISIWLRAAEVSGRLPMKCLPSTPSPHHKLLCNSSVDLQRKSVLQLLLLSVYLKKKKKSSLNQNKEKLFIWTEVHFSAQDYKHNSFAFLCPFDLGHLQFYYCCHLLNLTWPILCFWLCVHV